MDLELRGQEAETSCGQECGAQDQRDPEENLGVREHCLSFPRREGCGKIFHLLIIFFVMKAKIVRQGRGRRGLGPLTATPLSPFSGQEARGYT